MSREPISAIEPLGSAKPASVNKAFFYRTETNDLPSQQSVDLASSMARQFGGPNGSLNARIPEIADAIEGLKRAGTDAERAEAFKELAALLGIRLATPDAAQADGKGAASKLDNAPATGNSVADPGEGDMAALIKMLIQLFGIAFVRNLLRAMGKSPDEISALLGSAGTADNASKGALDDRAANVAGPAVFNRG